MRFVPVKTLIEGMVIGKSLYDKNQQLLLNKGCTVQKSYIDKIEKLGYQGIYIDDEWSKDIEIKDVISDELRLNAIKAIKDVCIFSSDEKNSPKQMGQHVKNTKLLVANLVEEILNNKDTMVNLIDLKFFDDYTYFHSVNVAVISVLIGVNMGLDRNNLFNLGLASILHDIGKMFIDKDILNKPGKLTEEEYAAIQQHPHYGFNYLKETFEISAPVYVGILQHHERYDGGGYPMNKKRDEIQLISRIISIADVYDALISKRPYREALIPSEAMEYIMANGGTMFDLEITKIFARKVAPFPVGTYVKLSNGLSGIVSENFEEACMRPTIKVFMNEMHEQVVPYYVELKSDKTYRSVTITGVNNLDIEKATS